MKVKTTTSLVLCCLLLLSAQAGAALQLPEVTPHEVHSQQQLELMPLVMKEKPSEPQQPPDPPPPPGK